MDRMEKIYLGIGTNLGDRLGHIRRAIHQLEKIGEFEITTLSSIYETEPIGYLNQPNFLNLVCEGRTTLTPTQLLSKTQSIEQGLKRVRTFRWGPRTIDIDILLFGNRVIEQPDLIVPHPRMLERAFVMVPLAEIAHHVRVPDTKRTVGEWAELIADQQGIRRVYHRLMINELFKEMTR